MQNASDYSPDTFYIEGMGIRESTKHPLCFPPAFPSLPQTPNTPIQVFATGSFGPLIPRDHVNIPPECLTKTHDIKVMVVHMIHSVTCQGLDMSGNTCEGSFVHETRKSRSQKVDWGPPDPRTPTKGYFSIFLMHVPSCIHMFG